jgi:AraC-like DNA-binding protein
MFDPPNQTGQPLAQLLPADSHGPRARFQEEAQTNTRTRESSGNQQSAREPLRFRTSDSGPATLDGRLAVVVRYMAEHLDQPMKISVLSALAGLSASRFFELFKRATGTTPLNWFIRARMRWASELLANSDLQIKRISAQVGYEDPFYFSRVFKSVYGIAPYDYRKHQVNALSAAPHRPRDEQRLASSRTELGDLKPLELRH